MENNQNYTRIKEKKSHKRLFVTIIVVIIAVIMALLIYYLFHKNNAKGQVGKFDQAIKENDYKQIAETLTNNNRTVTKNEARYFVQYIKHGDNYSQYKKEIKQIKANIQRDKQYQNNFGTIKDTNNKPILTFKRNGKRFLLFDKLAIVPHYYKVYVKELDNQAIYHYKLDKQREVVADSNKITLLGEFLGGKYSLDADKEFKNNVVNGRVHGQLFIDTNKKGQIIADDVFNQVAFKIRLKNADDIDKNTLKLNVNNHEVNYDSNKIYGKYPSDKNIKVFAKGKVDDKTFKSNTININKQGETQDETLTFDKAKIQRYKHDTETIKSGSKDFIKKYIDHLNKAYAKSDYDYVKNDIEKGSDLAKRIKKETKNKQKIEYKIKSFDKIERNGNKLNIKLTKSNNDYTTKATYTLKFDYKDKFEITEYKD